jgi:Ca2+-binding RTX toxin-like protein
MLGMTIVDHKNSNDNKHNHHYENLSTLGKILLFVGLLISFLSFSYFTFNNHFLLSVQAKSDNDCSSKDSNIIVGTRPITLGTKCNDVIIACPVIVSGSGLGSTCQNGDIVRGFEKNDVIQGSVGNDELYGDEGNDKIWDQMEAINFMVGQTVTYFKVVKVPTYY